VSRDGYKVFLSGEGADELFLGYHSYFRRRQREGKLHEAMIEQVENLHRYNNARLDKACMAHGVESRVPFQYGPLVEYAIAIEPELKMGNPTPANGLPDMQKYVLRRAVERLKGPVDGPLLPADVVWRRKEYYAKGMALPDLIAQALALPCQGMTDAEAARVRHQVYADRFLRLLLSPPAARGLTEAA
jgi:asparagine synthetase B (glutamine-hydrolysing)